MSHIPPILTVTQLNRKIKTCLEYDFDDIHVEGEISNLSRPASGHLYFTIKDATAQLRCVFFRNRHQPHLQELKNGSHVVARGQLSLYEARGDFQMIVEDLKDAGVGDLYHQFELLKIKLASLGLFATARKKNLPLFPSCIGVITSGSGAALQDILTTLKRRYPIASVFIYPCEVQGKQAAQQLIRALLYANEEKHCEVLILARGGGSIEDLWAFNNEELAFTIAQSTLPVVTGIGHETDFTIADFVADHRAPTPTAAAEAVTPNGVELHSFLSSLENRLVYLIEQKLKHRQLTLSHLLQKIASPKHLINAHWQKLDHLTHRLHHALQKIFLQKQTLLQLLSSNLQARHPKKRIQDAKIQINHLERQLLQSIQVTLQKHQQTFSTLIATLHAVSPLATLQRGYAIATFQNHVLTESSEVIVGDLIDIRLMNGQLTCQVVGDET